MEQDKEKQNRRRQRRSATASVLERTSGFGLDERQGRSDQEKSSQIEVAGDQDVPRREPNREGQATALAVVDLTDRPFLGFV